MTIKAFLALLLLFCIFLPTLAQSRPASQTPPPAPIQTGDNKDDVVRITTNLVQVDVVVTKDGKPVTNLTADDFEIFQDGRRQTITNFSYISNVRSTTGQPATDEKQPAAGAPYKPLKPSEAGRIMALVVDDLGLSVESMHRVRQQ